MPTVYHAGTPVPGEVPALGAQQMTQVRDYSCEDSKEMQGAVGWSVKDLSGKGRWCLNSALKNELGDEGTGVSSEGSSMDKGSEGLYWGAGQCGRRARGTWEVWLCSVQGRSEIGPDCGGPCRPCWLGFILLAL